ncbi:MAG TPA: glycosyltransferase, partial [Acidimicrobiales bacterium]|nr:glycosyltransferase [Acidimicrobiales bacterium]
MEPEAKPPAPPRPVVAVVVTHDPPAERLDRLVSALAAQTYPNLEVLVVDTGSEDPSDRVHAVLPRARVERVGDTGYGAAANTVLDLVAGAAFYLFCHDDVAPDRGAVAALVEAAERWDADVVGPKLVAEDDDHRLLQFGVTVDKLGVSLPFVERRELDQGQHDGLRDVFAVPGACTLVRATAFAEVGGFDEAI